MEEWKEYRLREITVMKNGKKRSQNTGIYPVYGGNGIMDYSDSYNAENTIIVGRVGAYCGCVYKSEGKCWVSDNAISVSANGIVNTDFLYYLMTTLDFHHHHIGGAQPLMTQDIIGDFVVVIPSLPIQNQIVSILKSLDDKIEVNRRINDNLEQQAQALFKSWFVDFEPFRNQPFVESELGMIPEGWRVGTLNDFGEIVGGSTPSKAKPEYYTDNGIAWLTPKDLSVSKCKFTSRGEIDITQEGYDSCSTKLMPKGTVLFSSRAPIGYITIAKNDICTNQGFKSVIPKLAGTAFIYCFLKESTQEIENKATGSTFKEASGSLMKSLPAIVPEKVILDDFEDLMKPIYKQQEVLEDENSRLSSLRDTLLPRLMSGELSVDGLKGQQAVSPGPLGDDRRRFHSEAEKERPGSMEQISNTIAP